MQEYGGWTATLGTAALALAAVLTALILAARGARAAGFGLRPGKRLAVIEAMAIDGKRRLVLVRCDGRELLLLTGGGTDQALGWLPEPPP
jgi:flagellar protein FliO/FliZ